MLADESTEDCDRSLVALLWGSIISPSCFQVYAPISGQDRSFHRTLFVFCCKTHECYTCNNNQCVKGNIVASVVTYSQRSSIDSSVLFSLCFCKSFPAHSVTFMFLSVFRSQLPRRNEFYSFHPPPGWSECQPKYNCLFLNSVESTPKTIPTLLKRQWRWCKCLKIWH